MEGTDLKPKSSNFFLKFFYAFLLLIFVVAGFFYLYGYLWTKFSVAVSKQLTQGVYIAGTDTTCTTNGQCVGVCDPTQFGPGDACLCLKGMCHFVENAREFVQSKFCEVDTDCRLSCYEGPVSVEYYDSVEGHLNDCSEGCAGVEYIKRPDGQPNNIVCKNRQCQYEDGQTCFIDTIN